MAAATAGLVLAIAAIVPPVKDLVMWWKHKISDARSFDHDYHSLSLKFDQLANRYSSTVAVLFEEGKFNFLGGSLFNELPDESKRVLLEMFKEIYRVLYDHYTLHCAYKAFLQPSPENPQLPPPSEIAPLSLTALQVLFDEPGNEPPPTKAAPKSWLKTLRWARKDKRRAKELNDQFEDWLRRIREVLEDSWWPLPIMNRSIHLQSFENDNDARTMGTAELAGLRKLVVDETDLPAGLELAPASLTSRKSFDDASRELAIFEGKYVLVEYLAFESSADGFLPQTLNRRFKQTAALLNRQSDPDFRALHCLGYIVREDSSRIELVFEIPTHFTVAAVPPITSLLQLLKSNKTFKPPLGSRFKLCYLLAQSLSLFHSVNWIHRAFRSDNVLFFKNRPEGGGNPNSSLTLDDPKISGFEVCRLETDFSTGPYDNTVSRNVYRHPDRWGIPNKTFTKYHDIYSLGIVFLEIGLWEKAETMGGNNFQAVAQDPPAVKAQMLRQAQRRLGHRCGDIFRDIVVRCIAGDFGVEREQDDRLDSQLQARFRELVIRPLEEMWDEV